MNTMKILIGATFALLLAALVLSYQNMKKNEHEDPNAALIERLERRLAELEAAQASNVSPTPQTDTNQFSPNALSQPSAQNPLEQQAQRQAEQLEMERLRQELANLREEKTKSERKADLAQRESNALLENEMERRQPETARANRIKQALLMARVKTWHADSMLVEIVIERPEDVTTGMVLGIRRNSGIIGRIKVSTIERNVGIADPIAGSFIGDMDIQEGDELIMPPAF